MPTTTATATPVLLPGLKDDGIAVLTTSVPPGAPPEVIHVSRPRPADEQDNVTDLTRYAVRCMIARLRKAHPVDDPGPEPAA